MFKELILLLGITAISLYFFADAPPITVQNALKEKFCDAQEIKWHHESGEPWQATFIYKEAKLSASFSKQGEWIKTTEAIPVSWFPAPVSGAIARDFTGWQITEADKTETAKCGLVFSANIKSGNETKEVAFNKAGEPLGECSSN